jgi:hypothetical protein
MGFGGLPPKPDLAVAVASLEMWAPRADAAIFHVDPPWKLLLAGGDFRQQITTEYEGLARFYRSRNLTLFVTFDATDGLGRDREARELREAGRSIAEPAVQQLYRAYVRAWVEAIQPSYVGLGAETNLIRLSAPRATYDGLKVMLNAAAADVRGVLPSATLYTTVQVETAWGRLQGTNTYIGIEEDFRDFPFAQVMGLSSYPYLGKYSGPEDVPVEYFSRLLSNRSIPVFVSEGGWSSATVPGVSSSPTLQARYVRRMGAILDRVNAFAYLQLNFADLDLTVFNVPAGYENILSLFARIGFVDSELRAKPALAVWDSLFALPRR